MRRAPDVTRVRSHVDGAVDLARTFGGFADRGLALRERAAALSRIGDIPAAVADLREALRMTGLAGDRIEEVSLRLDLSRALLAHASIAPDDAQRLRRESLAVCRAALRALKPIPMANPRRSALAGHCWRALVFHFQLSGDLQTAIQAAGRATTFFAEAGAIDEVDRMRIVLANIKNRVGGRDGGTTA
jgi:hypothetical protein